MNNLDVQRNIQNRLELILEEKSISKAEMARRSKLPSRTVENYFKGHTPSVDALLSLSLGLSVPLDWLLGDLSPDGMEIDTRFIRTVQDAAREYLDRMVKVDKSGEQVIRDGTVLGQDTNELAAKIARNAHQKFRYLSVFIGETMPVHSVEDD